MRAWNVAGGLILDPRGAVLLVQNQRRNGSLDWTPPGGVIDVAQGETMVEGLTREVAEETGLVVTRWRGPLWHVEATSVEMRFAMHVQVWEAVQVEGELAVGADPDGIVVDAAWVPAGDCDRHLEAAHPWVREPLVDWLAHRWDDARSFRYRISGTGLSDARAERL